LAAKCIECDDELLAERAELGYWYCTKKQCQAKHHKGLTITAVGVNKSADTFIVGDQEEIRRRAEAGEFAKKDSGLGINYRSPRTDLEITSKERRSSGSVTRRTPARRPWTREQEKIVRLYNNMGLTPRQIVERARENTPQLGITESLVTKIMCSPPSR
jgi:ribosomal protein L37AE/L43A